MTKKKKNYNHIGPIILLANSSLNNLVYFIILSLFNHVLFQ